MIPLSMPVEQINKIIAAEKLKVSRKIKYRKGTEQWLNKYEIK